MSRNPMVVMPFFEAESSGSAFDVFEQRRKALSGFLRARLDRDDAEELLARIRLRFIERLDGLRDGDQTLAFLFQIARDELKKHWLACRRHLALGADLDVEAHGCNPESSMLDRERLSLLRQCIDSLPDKTIHQVAVLRFRQGRRHAHIRLHLGLTVDQVKKCLKKAEIGITDCVRGKMVRL